MLGDVPVGVHGKLQPADCQNLTEYSIACNSLKLELNPGDMAVSATSHGVVCM
jgi:hypothetical protein